MAYNIIDLKQIDSQVFLQQKGFIWEQQRIAIEDIWSKDKPLTSPERQKKGITLYDLGSDC